MKILTSKLRALAYLLGPKYRRSYSQCGEDLIVSRLLRDMKISKPFYLDIGANDPVIYSNTYLFYKAGARGVLIEPDPAMCSKIRHKRRGDKCLGIGIATKTGTGESEFYLMDNSALNTFSKNEADAAVKHGHKIVKVIKVPTKTIAQVVAENKVGTIDFLSLDVEGMDFDVLKSIDFATLRPKIICVETKSFTGSQEKSPIHSFMAGKGYKLAGSTPINSIFTL